MSGIATADRGDDLIAYLRSVRSFVLRNANKVVVVCCNVCNFLAVEWMTLGSRYKLACIVEPLFSESSIVNVMTAFRNQRLRNHFPAFGSRCQKVNFIIFGNRKFFLEKSDCL